jgi:hypothetical protein
MLLHVSDESSLKNEWEDFLARDGMIVADLL